MRNSISVVSGIFAAALVCQSAEPRGISADSPTFFPNACANESAICTPYLASLSGSLQVVTDVENPNTSDFLTYQLSFVPGTGKTDSAAGVVEPESNGTCDYVPQYLQSLSSPPVACYAYMFNWSPDPANQSVPVTSQVMVFQYQDGQTGVFPGASSGTATLGAIEVDFNYTATKCTKKTASFTVNGTTYTATNPCAGKTNAFFFNSNSTQTGLILVGGVPSGWTVSP
jgi:hypothetical protein